MHRLEEFRRNDKFGNPRTHSYGSIGLFSPTTLRYIKVAADLKKLFVTLDHARICEIGVGYGGQCRILSVLFRPARYILVDIQPVLALARRFLDNFDVSSFVSYKTMDELEEEAFDLVISNYAFTELQGGIQDVYLRRVISRSRCGYITYNEITPPEFRSYKADQLVSMIPGATILPEIPLTHPRNCVIVWGNV